MTIRVLIVEDERPARAKIRRLLHQDPRFRTVGEAANGTEALRLIEELKPELVFLDVQIPGIDGFEVLDAVGPERDFVVVFSTAHDAYALRAFDAHAVDYLLKPYDGGRFKAALDKALRLLVSGERQVVPASHRRRLVCRTEGGWIALDPATVLRASAHDKLVILYTSSGEFRVRHGLSVLSSKLDPERFLRVHRGEIVRIDAVERYEPNAHGDGILTLNDGSAVALSRKHRVAFLERFRGR
jgi:two-component system, LytTR family, response regulator